MTIYKYERVRLERSRTEANHTCKRIQMGLRKIVIQYKTRQKAMTNKRGVYYVHARVLKGRHTYILAKETWALLWLSSLG